MIRRNIWIALIYNLVVTVFISIAVAIAVPDDNTGQWMVVVPIIVMLIAGFHLLFLLFRFLLHYFRSQKENWKDLLVTLLSVIGFNIICLFFDILLIILLFNLFDVLGIV